MTNFNGSVQPLGYQGLDILQQPIFIGNQVRAPGAGDVYQSGTIWDYVSGTTHTFYISCGGQPSGGTTIGVWTVFGSSSGDVIAVNGTTNQISAVTAAGTSTISLPSAITAPGSLTTTTGLVGGTGVTATTGGVTASAGNITATLGNIVSSAGSVSAATTVTAGTGVTATTGNVTATNGNLVLNGAGNKLVIHASTAASDSVGTSAALDGASPSQLVVSTTAVTSSSKIFLSVATAGGTPGFLSVGTIVNGTSFQILSSANGDTSTVNYLIIN
jgi:hypothetical protein